MVSSLLSDALASPTRSLLGIYNNYKSQTQENTAEDLAGAVSQYFSSIFEKPNAFAQIPLLDAENPPNSFGKRALVCFHCMIQDTSPSPEVYLATLGNGTCGGWGIAEDGDYAHGHEESSGSVDYNNLSERSVLWAVSIPGQAPWCFGEDLGMNKSREISAQSPSSSTSLDDKAHKFPIRDAPHVTAQIKIYDSPTDTFKPTELCTFVGILTSEPEMSEFTSGASVPTIHVLFHRPLPKTVAPTLFPYEGYEDDIREQLISWIATEALGDDRDAAEWVLLCCIASVQSRNPPLLPPALTLSQFPRAPAPNTEPSISHVLSELLPLKVLLPLSLDYLNNQDFVPESKNEDLHAGALQLPAGTVVLVTESGVQEGQILDKGVRNLQALQEVVKFQNISYKFPFSQFTFPSDLNVLVLTEGKKSTFCETNIVLPIRPQPNKLESLFKSKEFIHIPPPEVLHSFRQIIMSSKTGRTTIGPDASEHIQNDFVEERRTDKSISPDDLILRMTTAKLLALSLHQENITIEIWSRTKQLDSRRKERSAQLAH